MLRDSKLTNRLATVPTAAILLAAATWAVRAEIGTNTPPVKTEAPSLLPSVVVTATRTQEDPFALPYSVSVVGPVELEHKMPRNTPEALRDLPSVMLQKTSHGQGSPYIRGFTGFRTLMLVDGIRLNNSTFRDGPNQYWGMIDSYSLDHLELVRGPSSVMYGSDAIGGTVNAITLGRQDYPGGFDWNGRTFYRFSSAEDSHVGRPEVSGSVDDKFGFLIGGSIKSFGDVTGGENMGLQPKTGYTEQDFDAKLEYRINPTSRIVYGHQTVGLDDAWRTHSTIYAKVWDGTAPGTDLKRTFDQSRDLDYLQFHAEKLEGFAEEMHVSLSHQYQGETEERIRSNKNREVQDVNVHTLGSSFQLQSPSPIGRWVYGTEYYRDWVDSAYKGYNAAGNLTTVRLQGPVADDATYDLLGVFAEDHIPLASDRLELTLGGRFTHAQVDAGKVLNPFTNKPFSMSDSWDNAVGNARLSFQPDEAKHWMIYGGASQGFRAPNLSDLTRFDIARTKEQEVPAFGLKPEHFVSPEIGIKSQFKRFTAEATYFHTFINDAIVRVPTGAVTPTGDFIVNKENSGDGYVHGVELSGSYKLHRDWTLWANSTWMEGTLDIPRVVGGPVATEPMSRIMPATVNSGLRWWHPKGRVWVEFATTFAAKQDRLSSSDVLDTQRIPPGGTPGYDVYHLRAGWNPCRQATITLALENLTDKDYRIHGSGLNEPGRNLILTAEVRF
jgi:hemoglobin/transferrin/lactoferrin receptor protein